MILEKQKIDKKAVAKAFGQVQRAIKALEKTFQQITLKRPSPDNFRYLVDESSLDLFLREAFSDGSPVTQELIQEFANPAALMILEDPNKTLHQKLRAVFSEANRNLMNMYVYSRRDSQYSDYMDRFQNMLMVERGVRALSANFDYMSGAVANPLEALSAEYQTLLSTVEDQKSVLAKQLRIEPQEVQIREKEAERFLRESLAVSYIAPMLPA